MNISPKKGMALMALCAVMWSISGVFIKMIPWHSLVISGWRSLVAGGVCFCYLIWRKYPFVVNRSTLLCGLALSATMLLYIAACKMTTSANAIILQSTSPVFIMVLSTVFLGDRYRKIEYALVFVVLGGIGLFFLDQLTPGGLAGNLLAIASGLTLAVMFLLSSRLPDDQSSQSALLLGHLITAAIGIPLTFVFPIQVTARPVAAIVMLGVVQLGIPYVLYGIAVRACAPLACSLIGMLEPLLNPVWVLLALGEVPGPFALIGGVVVLGSVCAWMLMNASLAARQKKAAQNEQEDTNIPDNQNPAESMGRSD